MSTVEISLARRRYADVEAAYTSGQYAQALNEGLSLLQDLEDPANKPLKMRLLLLLAHTWLYGLGDQDSAAVAYRQVAEESEEGPLQEIATEGLRRSNAAVQPGPTPGEQEIAANPEPLNAGRTSSVRQKPASNPFSAPSNPEQGIVSAAAPWLSDLNARNDRIASNRSDGMRAEALAPFQQPSTQAASIGPLAGRPPGRDQGTTRMRRPNVAITQTGGATRTPEATRASETPFTAKLSVSSGSPVTVNPKASAGSWAVPDATTGAGTETRAGQSDAEGQASTAEGSQRRGGPTATEPVIVQSTISFSAEEEQELAKGLLLVVLG